ncbi:MAG: hypothetical protein ACOC1X_02660 [Promethearchaeota archaeon]
MKYKVKIKKPKNKLYKDYNIYDRKTEASKACKYIRKKGMNAKIVKLSDKQKKKIKGKKSKSDILDPLGLGY